MGPSEVVEVGSVFLNLDKMDGLFFGIVDEAVVDSDDTSGVKFSGCLLRDLLAKNDFLLVASSGLGVVNRKSNLVFGSPEAEAFLRLAKSSLNSFFPWNLLLALPLGVEGSVELVNDDDDDAVVAGVVSNSVLELTFPGSLNGVVSGT